MPLDSAAGMLSEGHIPHGMCGLKSDTKADAVLEDKSHPSRDVWIEIAPQSLDVWHFGVTSLTGCVD